MKTIEKFKPVPFTGITSSQRFWMEAARKNYTELCHNLNAINFGLQSILSDGEELPEKTVLDFVKCLNPEQFIKQLFVEYKNVSIPGLKQTAFMNSDMLDIPEEKLREVLSERLKFDVEYLKAKKRFDFPIHLLYVAGTDGDSSVFDLTDAFEQQLDQEHTGYAMNQDQLTVVEAMGAFTSALNNLINLGIVPPNHINYLFESGPFNRKVLSMDPYARQPVTLCKHIFSQISLGRYKIALSKYRTGKVRASASNELEETNTSDSYATNADEV